MPQLPFVPREDFSPKWPDAGTLPPGWPRKFAGPDGGIFAAEEDPNVLRRALLAAELEKQGIPIPNAGDIDILAGAIGDGGSPSDRPPSGFRPRGFQPSPGVESGIVPAGGGGGGGVPFNMDWHRNEALADIAIRQAGSALGRGNTRYQKDMAPRPPKVEQPPVLPGGINDIRMKYLGGNSPLDKRRQFVGQLFGGGAGQPAAAGGGSGMLSGDETKRILANITAERESRPAVKSQEQNVFEAALGRGESEQEASAKAQAFMDRLHRVNSTETHERENQDRATGLMRHQEHQLFRESPRAWAMWRMMGGGQGGGAPPDQAPPFGGNMGGAGAMAMMFGDPQAAEYFAGQDRTNAQREGARGQLAVAEMQHYREAMTRWQGMELQRQGSLAEVREKVRGDLTAQLGKEPDPDLLAAEVKRRAPELSIPIPQPIQPAGMPTQRVPRREEILGNAGGVPLGGAGGGPTVGSSKWADKLRTADRAKLANFIVDNFGLVDEKASDLQLALASAGIPKNAFIKAIWDATNKTGSLPGATIWGERDSRNKLRQLLLSFGVPADVVPGEFGLMLHDPPKDRAKSKAYYESLSK